MNARQLTITYLATYLSVGGIALAIAPEIALGLLQSNGDYGDIMPRMVGLFMVVLGLLFFVILRHQDWKYYPLAIYARIGIVVFLSILFTATNDPFFLIINVIVLIGLLPSIYVHFFRQSQKSN